MCGTKERQEQVKEAQLKELVEQESKGVGVMMATVTCPCGWRRGLTLTHKCLYCGIYFCVRCAEQHFGKTVEQYRIENPLEN